MLIIVKVQGKDGEGHSRDVLLGLVIFLGQVPSGRFAGDAYEGQLLVVACHIARRLAHAIVIVLLHQEICGEKNKTAHCSRWCCPLKRFTRNY